MTMFIQLLEKDEDGQILKNEQYSFEELKGLMRTQNPGFFTRLYMRVQRKLTLEVLFETFESLIHLDKPGTHRVKIRDQEGGF